jgi:hypothetical protein
MGKVKREPCAFCPATANITGEHLWSDWASKLLAPRKYTFRREINGQIFQWERKVLDEKAPVVCGTCNSGWMSDIENRAKSVIADMVRDGTAKVLNALDIATIAVFAFLKAVICDHMNEQTNPFYSFQERQLFRITRAIPNGVQMHLASVPGIQGMFKGSTIYTALNAGPRFEVNVFTYGLGHFLVQVTGVRWMKKSRRKYALPPRLSQSIDFTSSSLPIWPDARVPISWPPPLYLAGEALQRFVNRWKDLEWKTRLF